MPATIATESAITYEVLLLRPFTEILRFEGVRRMVARGCPGRLWLDDGFGARVFRGTCSSSSIQQLSHCGEEDPTCSPTTRHSLLRVSCSIFIEDMRRSFRWVIINELGC